MSRFQTFGVPEDIEAYQAVIKEITELTMEAYVSAREVERQAQQDLRDEALALARDHEREADEWVATDREPLYRHTASFLRYIAGRL